MRIFWFCFGVFFTICAALGVILPLLPTVPFLLLAAFCFSKSSKRAHDWLFNHPTFGPHLQDWQAHGVIRLRTKYIATATIAATFGISVIIGLKIWVLGAQACVLGCVLYFIWTRPSTPRP